MLRKLCEELVTKVNAIDTSKFVLKPHYSTDKSGLEKKIDDADNKTPDTSELAKNADYNPNIIEMEG